MMIARSGKTAHFAGGIARSHHADFEVEIESLLGNGGPCAEADPRGSN